MNLEVRVNDRVQVTESLPEAIAFVVQAITEWYASADDKPLTITLRKQGNKSPPALGIHVSDEMDIGERFG